MEVATLLDALSKLGVLGACAVIIVALVKEELVPKGRINELREIAKERLTLVRSDKDKAMDHAEKLAKELGRMADALEEQNRLLEENNRLLRGEPVRPRRTPAPRP